MDSICVWTCKGLPAEAADHRVGCSTLGPVTFIRRGHTAPAPATASPDAEHQSPTAETRACHLSCPVSCTT